MRHARTAGGFPARSTPSASTRNRKGRPVGQGLPSLSVSIATRWRSNRQPEALLNPGRILEANGKSEEARNCWSKALEAEPALAQGYFGPAID